jgi:hypothetical protein
MAVTLAIVTADEAIDKDLPQVELNTRQSFDCLFFPPPFPVCYTLYAIFPNLENPSFSPAARGRGLCFFTLGVIYFASAAHRSDTILLVCLRHIRFMFLIACLGVVVDEDGRPRQHFVINNSHKKIAYLDAIGNNTVV